jgi:hypothetical protein
MGPENGRSAGGHHSNGGPGIFGTSPGTRPSPNRNDSRQPSKCVNEADGWPIAVQPDGLPHNGTRWWPLIIERRRHSRLFRICDWICPFNTRSAGADHGALTASGAHRHRAFPWRLTECLTVRIFPACKFQAHREKSNSMELTPKQLNGVGPEGALSSVVEHYLHTVGVAGSKPAARTTLYL